MTDSIITRCPKCATAFRVTQDLLGAASGTVRCGSCLHIFNAEEYSLKKPTDIASDTQKQAGKQENKPQTTNNKPAQKPTATNDSLSSKIRFLPLQESDNDEAEQNSENSSPGLFSIQDEIPLVNTIKPEPLEFTGTEEKPRQRWPWPLAIIAMGIVLFLQFAWMRFDTLNQHPSYRPYYQQACNILGCELPAPRDLSKIHTTHLSIRNHPRASNALAVDVIIINTANFEQAYPALQLEFHDINNQHIAGRNFQPHEYLKGELKGATTMPVNQPIQLALAIVDPGKSAVNYHIRIVPALSANR